MKILVIGAAGKTGEAIVKQALGRGHTVTAFVHEAKGFEGDGARVIEGNVLDAAVLESAIAGQDAVLDALGGHTPWKESTLETNAARNVINGMKKHEVKRLLVVSAIGVSGTEDLVPGWYEHLIMPTLLRGAMHDKEHMEPIVEASGLEWTLVRPGHLVDGEATGKIHFFEPGSGEIAHKITRADVATFMLDLLANDLYKRQAANIASN
ncbi:MAG: NAD(P)-dependent oxidoreductase [Janthinobacterium lividum]